MYVHTTYNYFACHSQVCNENNGVFNNFSIFTNVQKINRSNHTPFNMYVNFIKTIETSTIFQLNKTQSNSFFLTSTL